MGAEQNIQPPLPWTDGDPTMKKTDVLELLREQPEDLDIDRFIYTLYVRRQIEIGIAAADASDEISHEEFVELSEQWLE